MILDRYVLKEQAGPFFFSMVSLTSILLLNQVLKLLRYIVDKDIPLPVVGELFLLSLPFIVVLTVPMAVLLANVLAFGRLAEDHELVAMKAAGIPLFRTMAPSLLAAAVMGAGLAVFQNRVLPETNHRIRNLTADIARKKPTFSLEEGVVTKLDERTRMRAEKVDHRTGELRGVRILEIRTGAPPVYFVAPRGRSFIGEDGVLTIELFDGEILDYPDNTSGQLRRTKFQTYTFVFDVESELVRTDSDFRGDRELSTSELLARIAENRRIVEEEERKITEERRKAEWPPTREEAARWERWRKVREAKIREINRYWVEVHKKYAISAACISFVLIGAPLGAIPKRGGNAVGVIACLGLFIAHYVFLVGGERMADRGVVSPAVAMWGPDVVVALIGVWLVYTNMQEAVILRFEWLDRLLAVWERRRHRAVKARPS